MDFDGSNRTRITNDTIRFGEKLFSLNGTQIFCLASGNYYNDQIVRINIDGTNLVKLTTTELPYSYDYIQLSPDGNKLLFTQWNGQNSNIYVIDVNGANLSQLTRFYISQFRISDGRYF